jgi:1,4-dihydroxy-2-naphthoyl-CoA hydrolase
MNIWRTPLSLDQVNAAADATLIRHLGIVFTEIGEDFIRGTMPVDQRTCQPYGLLHGGASVVLAETLGSTGANMCVDAAQYACVGQEINANHVRSARDGKVIGTARLLHLGGRSQVWGIDVRDAADELICISRLTIAVIKRGQIPPAGIR